MLHAKYPNVKITVWADLCGDVDSKSGGNVLKQLIQMMTLEKLNNVGAAVPIVKKWFHYNYGYVDEKTPL